MQSLIFIHVAPHAIVSLLPVDPYKGEPFHWMISYESVELSHEQHVDTFAAALPLFQNLSQFADHLHDYRARWIKPLLPTVVFEKITHWMPDHELIAGIDHMGGFSPATRQLTIYMAAERDAINTVAYMENYPRLFSPRQIAEQRDEAAEYSRRVVLQMHAIHRSLIV